MIIGFLNAALLVIQMITHILMMIRWYRENPIIERRVKRSIKVGLPVEPDKNKVEIGHAVPEADRKARPEPIKKTNKVFGIPFTGIDEAEKIKTPLAEDESDEEKLKRFMT